MRGGLNLNYLEIALASFLVHCFFSACLYLPLARQLLGAYRATYFHASALHGKFTFVGNNTVKLVKTRLNPSLALAGILLTMFDTRNLLSHRVSEDVRTHLGSKVFNTVIHRNVRLSESPSHGLPIILYDIRSRGAISYMELAQELMTNGRI
jgi:cellulose biosynthesis protein BcsQ